ncbi:hypothetical protein [Dongia sp.]|uniref:hypothetical protein n=1 Tax=Dongia sp. TaxID=1977262 RepID=UPI0035B4DA3B
MDDWTMSDEREFMENLLNERFNFYLVVYGAVVVSAGTVESWFAKMIILIVGAILLALLLLTIGRAQVKLDYIIGELCATKTAVRLGHCHPVAVIDERARHSKTFPRGRRRLVGFYIPAFCFVTVYLAAAFASCFVI